MLVLALLASGCAKHPKPVTPQPAPAPVQATPTPLVPAVPDDAGVLPSPKEITLSGGSGLAIGPQSRIYATNTPDALRIAGDLATFVARATGARPVITPFADAPPQPVATGSLTLAVTPGTDAGGAEGYDLAIDAQQLRLTSTTPAGLFYGVQTIRQLLPYWSEYEAVMFRQPKPATLPALHIRDAPRYQWRGAMLDVARHFFTVDEVKRFIDLLALHKMNRLHLHLADDQGWRVDIAKWPDLTAKGGLSEVGGTPGGFYTKAQYAEIVGYAADRFITIVPEIDMPGHTNAALSSYAQLNCTEQATQPFTGTAVGFSALCVDHEITYQFIDDVVREIAAMTPGPYVHIGGDEVKTLTPAQYTAFIERVQGIVQSHGKQMIGWDEIAAASLLPTSIVQHWRTNVKPEDLARAPRFIISRGDRAYLDMKYDRDTALGLNWAGLIPVRTAYDWDPSALVPGAAPDAILGVEAPLWSETIANIRDLEFLAMPRLAAIAEVAWAPAERRDWDRFRVRLGQQGPRWSAIGINFYRAPEIPWK
jgi:hexosaminidase